MNISGLLSRFFGRETEAVSTKNTAKERLRLVLVHDRLDVSEGVMEQLREDLIATIGRYMEIDREALDVSLSREDDGVALVANIPVKGMKRGGEAQAPAAPALAEKPAQVAKPAAQTARTPAAPTAPAAPQSQTAPAVSDAAQAMLRAARSAVKSTTQQ